MLLVTILTIKAGVTLATVIHAHAVVDFDVSLEVAETSERFLTNFALVAMLQSVVLVQFFGRVEDFEAVGTATVLGKGVCLVGMNFELSEEGEGEVALAALVWLPSHVSLQY